MLHLVSGIFGPASWSRHPPPPAAYAASCCVCRSPWHKLYLLSSCRTLTCSRSPSVWPTNEATTCTGLPLRTSPSSKTAVPNRSRSSGRKRLLAPLLRGYRLGNEIFFIPFTDRLGPFLTLSPNQPLDPLIPTARSVQDGTALYDALAHRSATCAPRATSGRPS